MTYRYSIGYGKRGVPVYRTNAAPLTGIAAIPESPFTGRKNRLFAYTIDVEVLGGDFLPAYTAGDNSNVVATDSMKNFIIRKGLEYPGATLEGFLYFLGDGFIGAYEQLADLRLTGQEIPFREVPVPDAGGDFDSSQVLFDRVDADASVASLEMVREPHGPTIRAHSSGQIGLRLMKTTGSSFTSFVRDGFTTLPDRRDRPLFITLDVTWRYADVQDAVGSDYRRYVPAEQIRDFIRATFHGFVSESIQHLVHEFGMRLLERFPQLSDVSFRAENRTRDPWGEHPDDPAIRVFSDPFPAFGEIRLTMAR